MVKQEENFLIIDKELTGRVECLYKNNEQANAKYREAMKNNAMLKEQIENLRSLNNELVKSRQTLEQQCAKVQRLNAEYAEELSKYVEDYDETIGLLQNLKRFVLRLETQNDYLRRENESYQRKFAKIFDTWFGRLALKCYRWLIALKGKMKGKLKPILK
jgi:DNA repair ATPase RecN